MMSIKAAARASILAFMMIAAVLAEPGESKLRENPLSALDNHDLAELLEMDLDEVFLVPKTMLQGRILPKNKKHHRSSSKRQNRHLQEGREEGGGGGGSPSPSLSETGAPTDGSDRGMSFTASPSIAETGAPTDATDRGLSSSYFSYSSPSAAPTAAPTATTTMGSGSRGGLFGTVTPTASPSSAGSVFDLEEDTTNDDVDAPREVAAAPMLLSVGSGAGVAVAVVTATLAVVAGVIS